MLENVIKKLFPIRDEEDRPCTFPTFASQVFFNDGSVLEGKQFGGGSATVDPLDKFEIGVIYHFGVEVNPPEKYGGEWEKINGRILIGTGTPEANSDGTSPGSYNYALGSKGGEEKHKLTDEEMANHTHNVELYSVTGDNQTALSWKYEGFNNGETAPAGNVSYAGGDKPHNNMPPYLAVYMWKRVS